MKKNLLFKLAKILTDLKLSEVETDKGLIVYDGELEIGVEIFVYDETGELIMAPNDTYMIEGKEITVEDGKVTDIKEPEAEEGEIVEEVVVEAAEEGEEEPTKEEPTDDEKDKMIAELEEKLAAAEAKIAELEDKLGAAEAEMSLSKQQPAYKTAGAAEGGRTKCLAEMVRDAHK